MSKFSDEEISEEEEPKPKPKPKKKTLDDSDEEWEPTGIEVVDTSYQGAGVLKLYYTTIKVDEKTFNQCHDVLLALEVMRESQNLAFLKIDCQYNKYFKTQMEKISKKKELPQLFLDGTYLGVSLMTLLFFSLMMISCTGLKMTS